jgi:hypothetical protein
MEQTPEEYQSELHRELAEMRASYDRNPTEYKEQRIARLEERLGIKT